MKNELLLKFKKYPLIYNISKNILEKSLIFKEKEFVINELNAFSDFVLNRDNLRNILNSKFDFSNEISNFDSFEKIHDKLNDIVIEQKSKRLIREIYSNKYRKLINEDTLKIFKIIIENNIEKKTIQDLFSSKLKIINSSEENNDCLNDFLNKQLNWNKYSFEKKILNFGSSIINNSDDFLCVEIKNYNESKHLGSGQWCISYSFDHYINYKERYNSMFFIYDFSKSSKDKESMIGMVFDEKFNIKQAHWRNDDILNNEDIKKYKDIIIKNYKIKKDYLINNKINYINEFKDTDCFSSVVITEADKDFNVDNKLKILDIIIKNEKSFNLNSLSLDLITRILETECSSIKKELIKKKIKKIIKRSENIYGSSFIFINKCFNGNNLELIKLVLEKDVELNNFGSKLDINIKNKSKEEIEKFIEIISYIYEKRKFNSNILKSDILTSLMSFSIKNEKEELKNFYIEKIIEITKNDLNLEKFINHCKNKNTNSKIYKITDNLVNILINYTDNINFKSIIKDEKLENNIKNKILKKIKLN